jgi:short-subunit dehydrogenase
MKRDTSFENRVIVITGASSGIGKGAAREFARRGASIVLAARRENLLDQLAHECRLAGGKAVVRATDVGNAAEVDDLAQAALSHFGGFDVWINDAGVGALGRFEEIPVEHHEQTIRTNLMGTIFGSRAALRHFRIRERGTLINIAAALGKFPAPYHATYTASKCGIVGLSAAIRQELREDHLDKQIRVCTVMPMAMDTPFFDHAANYTGHEPTPVPPLYDPQMVVDTLVRLVQRPEDEVVVGATGKVFAVMHNLMPAMFEHYLADQTYRAQMEKSPPAPHSEGAVLRPMDQGDDVHGGRLAK